MRSVGRFIRWVFVALGAVLVVWAFADVLTREAGRMFAQSDQIKLQILFWGDNRERAIIDELIAAYEAANPGVTVEPLHASDFDSKLKTMLASGDPPDAFYVPAERLFGSFAEQGLLLPLDEFVAAEGPAFLDGFFPQLVDSFRWNAETHRSGEGPLYGIPKGFTTTVNYVNLDLFEAAGVPVPYDGWTWDEYADAVEKITALGHVPGEPGKRVWGGVIQTWNWVLMNHVWTFGGDFFRGDFTDPTVTDPRTVEALQFLQDLRFEEKTVYNATGIAQAEDELFRLGQVGVIGTLGRWKVPTYRQVDFRWDVVPPPHKNIDAPVSPIVTVCWAISAETPHPEETWELLTFLCGERGQALIAELGLEIPSLKSVAASDAYHREGSQPANSQLFIDQLETARPIQFPLQTEFTRFLDEELQSATLSLGNYTAAEGAARVEKRWMDLLDSPLDAPDLPAMPWRTLTIVLGAFLIIALGVTIFFASRQKIGRIEATEQRTGWSFVGLWVIGFLLFTLGPMAVSFLLSFTSWEATGPLSAAKFVGVGNYARVFTDDASFRQSVKVTMYYTLLAVPLTQALAILVALLMNLNVRGIGIFRTAYFVPSVVSGVALVTLWISIFDNSRGMLNAFLRPILDPLGVSPPDWFGTDSALWASPALVIMTTWGVGAAMVIYLAGLKSVPRSLHEAACLDGAGPVRRLWNVTLPMISPIIFFQVVMAIIASFQIFTQAFVIRGATGGTNRDLLFYVLNLYDEAFRFHNMGYASALAWVLFAAILLLTLLVFRGSKGLVHYEGLR
ncbi:MAG: extracellular solute-binding protein [Phycisphaerales bacterium]